MNIYEELGVKRIINGLGTVTKIGGSKMPSEVIDAMREASKSYVDINEFHSKAGQKIAKLLGYEAACITSGATAGIAISAAACMSMGNIAKVLQLPDATGMKNEVLVLKAHRTLYDQALLVSGAKVKEIGATSSAKIEQLEHAINNNTAMFFYAAEAERMRGSLPLTEISKTLRKFDIPLVVDAAAEIPPKSNVTKYLDLGADLVIFSGGKEFRGPQSSGLILGKSELIKACDANCCPNYSIGRGMKIDKETIAGIVKAIEIFVNKEYDLEMDRWEKIVKKIIDRISGIPYITARKGYPIEPGIQPVDIPRVYIKSSNNNAFDLQSKLMSLDPMIYTNVESGELVFNPQCIEDDEVEVIIASLISVL